MKNAIKVICAVLCIAMLLASCGGGGDTSSVASGASSDASSVTSSTGAGTGTTVDNVKIFDTDVWQAVPMVSQAMVNSGYKGGEGCQWPNPIEFDPIEGKYAIFGTDTGGVFRSENGGITWEPSTLGLDNRGGVGNAFDPNNTQRVMLVGSVGDGAGLYLSTDAAKTWKLVHKQYRATSHDWREQLAFDESSYDKTIGGSKVVYWLCDLETDEDVKKYNLKMGLFKSEDGGETWNHISGTEKYTGGWLSIDKSGTLYIANSNGVHKSTDGGKTFTQVFSTETNALCIIRTKGYEKYVYAMTNEGLYLSKDSGATFNKVTTQMPTGAMKNYTFLEVSPANPNKMVMQNNTLKFKNYDLPSYYSTDGGKTWLPSSFDTTTNVWAPFNPRQHPASFHPTNENIVITLGTDGVYRSTDGGKTFKMSSVGYNVIMSGGNFYFNYNNPKLVAVSAQDYNGGFSTDGGKTWKYMNWSGAGWGGHTYGAYALTENTVVAILSSEWAQKADSVQRIAVTYDGGKTFTKTEHLVDGSLVVCGVKGDNNIVFAGEWRSTDGAKTWQKMNGCTGVFTCDTKTGWLFGKSSEGIVVSKDKGATWTLIFETKDAIKSICYNPEHGKVYYTVTSGPVVYFKWTDGHELSKVWYSALGSMWNVCVDPNNMNVMYAVGFSEGSYTKHNVYRSLDGGKTWTGITRQVGDGRTGPDGANQATNCAVNPVTGELFVGTHCCGFWKISGPPANAAK